MAADPKPRKPAVIMDLDETVLDNSAFESFLFENNAEYADDLWEMYERDYPGEVRLVAGVYSCREVPGWAIIRQFPIGQGRHYA